MVRRLVCHDDERASAICRCCTEESLESLEASGGSTDPYGVKDEGWQRRIRRGFGCSCAGVRSSSGVFPRGGAPLPTRADALLLLSVWLSWRHGALSLELIPSRGMLRPFERLRVAGMNAVAPVRSNRATGDGAAGRAKLWTWLADHGWFRSCESGSGPPDTLRLVDGIQCLEQCRPLRLRECSGPSSVRARKSFKSRSSARLIGRCPFFAISNRARSSGIERQGRATRAPVVRTRAAA